jgi:hypothetical protein
MEGMTATTPFLEFRLWWRRASAGQQSAAVGALVTVLALIIWIAVPLASGPSSTNLGAGSNGARALGTGGSTGAGPGGAGDTGGAAGAGPAAAGSGSSTGTSLAAGGPSAAGAGGAGGAAGSPGALLAAGCSGQPKNTSVGVVLINAAGLNSVLGVPSVSSQQAMWSAAIDSINKSGGAGCNHLVADFQTYNESDSSTAQSSCLAFVQHKDFAVLSGFLPQNPDTCLLQNHIPVVEEIPISSKDLQQFSPYYFSAAGQIQVIYRNFANAARQFNVFNPANGFKKVGVFYSDCQPEVNAAMMADLQAVGVPPSAIDRSDLGCPSSFAAPSVIEQAVLKFKSDGVTTATIDNDIKDTQNITKTSQAQGFHPRWAIPDMGTTAVTANPAFAPDPNNFDGALAISPNQYGANNSPGFHEGPADTACDQIMTSHGQPGTMTSPDQFAGAVCNLVWMFAAALDHAPSPAPDQLAAGLQRVGSIPFAFPDGPNNFSAPGTTTGGEFWRPLTYFSSCGCWRLANPNFQPSF